jgi:NAD(P)-dependent dehydrogenase (short-subunit alcohol dehydrogenase family)
MGLGIATRFVQAGARVLVGRRGGVLKEAAEKLGEAATYQAHDITRLDVDALFDSQSFYFVVEIP